MNAWLVEALRALVGRRRGALSAGTQPIWALTSCTPWRSYPVSQSREKD